MYDCHFSTNRDKGTKTNRIKQFEICNFFKNCFWWGQRGNSVSAFSVGYWSLFFLGDHRDLKDHKDQNEVADNADTRTHFGLLVSRSLGSLFFWDHWDLKDHWDQNKVADIRWYPTSLWSLGLLRSRGLCGLCGLSVSATSAISLISRSRGLFGHYFLFRTLSLTCVIFSRKPPSLAKFSLTRSRYLWISDIACLISTIVIFATTSSFLSSARDTK